MINSTKRKFTYLPAVHICDLVSKQGSPVAAYSSKSLPTSRYNLSVPSSRFKNIADKCVRIHMQAYGPHKSTAEFFRIFYLEVH